MSEEAELLIIRKRRHEDFVKSQNKPMGKQQNPALSAALLLHRFALTRQETWQGCRTKKT